MELYRLVEDPIGHYTRGERITLEDMMHTDLSVFAIKRLEKTILKDIPCITLYLITNEGEVEISIFPTDQDASTLYKMVSGIPRRRHTPTT